MTFWRLSSKQSNLLNTPTKTLSFILLQVWSVISQNVCERVPAGGVNSFRVAVGLYMHVEKEDQVKTVSQVVKTDMCSL